jgi:Xaa-Pro dipeptidase
MELDWHRDRSDLLELALLDQLDANEPIDLVAVRAYRLGRVRAQMETHSLDACVLLDPVNIRYATGARNMQVFHARNPARAVKSVEELKCVRASVRATEVAVRRLREAMRPGLTEQELWSVLHQGVIALGGDYVETRLLSSGTRTNPWFQETGDRRLAANELVALDTDVVGCHGYYCDFSRTFHTGPDQPTRQQRELYQVAYEQVHYNIELLRPGVTFREYSEKAWTIPDRYVANRYFVSAHGCGMTGEYPYLYHGMDFADSGYDGVIEAGMTLCVESYIGDEGGHEGVKLEQQLLITDPGPELLSSFPFESALLGQTTCASLRMPSETPASAVWAMAAPAA